MGFHSWLNSTYFAKRHRLRLGAGAFFLLLCIHYINVQSLLRAAFLRRTPFPPRLEPIPHKVWQIFFGYSPLGHLGDLVQTWPTKNQDFSYTLLSNDGGNAFARKHYAHRPEILNVFLDLKFPVFRSDLLRYMILESEGGIYSDLDTLALHPFTEWIPQAMKDDVRFVVGIEYDQGEGEPYYGMTEPLQFCQWTMASAPGHPIVRKAVTRVVDALHTLAAKQHVAIAELNPPDDEVIPVSGPLIWTTVIMDVLTEMTALNVSHKNFTGLKEPKLVGDVLVLPVDGFGTGQPHSGANRVEGYTPPTAMVRHLWKGSWKHGWSN
ncbi:MAG: hypothetical protein Q9163_003544 [Psora crenata]